MARDYYGILGVDRNASDADIKKAFRRKARKYHPDVNDSAEAADKFNELKIAQEVLTEASSMPAVTPRHSRIMVAQADSRAASAVAAWGIFSSSSSVVRAQECVGRNRVCALVTTLSSA